MQYNALQGLLLGQVLPVTGVIMQIKVLADIVGVCSVPMQIKTLYILAAATKDILPAHSSVAQTVW